MLLPGDFIEFERAEEDKVTLVQVRQKAADHGGGTFAKMRHVRPVDLRTSLPGRISRNCVDHVVAQVVCCLESTAGTEHDIALNITWADLAPRRLYSSSAFAAAISFYINTWEKARQAAAPFSTTVIDRKAYGKTLGYLRSALRDPQQAYDTGTLAAIALIHKIEVDFDGRRCFATPSSHAAGLYALAAARGPPRLHDELDVHLCFETMTRLMMHVIMNEEDNFYTHMDWMEAMREALRAGVVEHSPYKNLYALGLHLAQWPNLAIESRQFHLNPNPLWGLQIAAKISRLSEELHDFEKDKISPLWDIGVLWTVPDLEAPWSEAYHFMDWPTSQVFIMRKSTLFCPTFTIISRSSQKQSTTKLSTDMITPDATISIAAARMQAAALEYLGKASPQLEQQTLEWSQRIWKSQAYIDRFRLAAIASIASLILSYESAAGRTREVILTKLQRVSSPLQGYVATDPVLIKACRIATGRIPYPEPYSSITGAPIICHGHSGLSRLPS
ncbi:hypothetical protein FHL15_005676 [Xylaria flabelliformis]|uniref:Transcription factor domain-containing protein n=1 Tax=Xylaria flabelliformis TaxID=2512241 RepID=A0A553HZN4_9PEZI|nr:hypothetical protein FHL15_005676 [Xylaria flabelliformis]